MKINYLILAHSNFSHLKRLVEALDTDGVTFYIHFDSKVKSPPEFKQGNVIVIPNRYNIGWGSYAMVRATLALMEIAYDHSREGRYVLISGVDYPVTHNEQIQAKLSEDFEFISIAEAPLEHKPLSRYDRLHLNFDRRVPSLKSRFLSKLEGIINDRIKFRRSIPFPVYAGGSWWALTHNCIGYILDTIRQDKRYASFFKYAMMPDEAIFQTIIGNSHFLLRCRPTLTFTDWTTIPAPSIINETHVNKIKWDYYSKQGYGHDLPLFARKFDDTTERISDLIDRELRNQSDLSLNYEYQLNPLMYGQQIPTLLPEFKNDESISSVK